MTFEQWWKEYLTKHKIIEGDAFEKAIKSIAEEAWGVSHEDAYWEGREDGWYAGYDSRS